MSFTPGPWFVSGVRFKMNGGEWLGVNRYDESKKKDENIACVGFDPRTGAGWDDAHLIAAARDLLDFVKWVEARGGDNNQMEIFQRARTLLTKAQGQPSVSGGENSQ